MRRQKSSALLQQRTRWRRESTSAASATCNRLIIPRQSGGNQRNTCPIKHHHSARLATLAAGCTGTPRFCPAPSKSAVPVRELAPPNLLSYCLRATNSSHSSLPSLNPPSGLHKAHFSTSRAVMGAVKIDGTAIAKRIRASLHAEIGGKKKINPRYIPSLKIIQGVSTSTKAQTTSA